MKVLLLSFYYKPDLSAGSFRNTAFVASLRNELPEGSEVHVVTTLPNRYSGFTAQAPETEIKQGLTIKRIKLPAHQSGMTDQSRAFLAYAKQALQFARTKKYDVVFASSSRLMTAVLGATIARQQRTMLYLDIRDIFVDTIKDVLPRKLAWFMKPLFSAIEHWAISRADRLNVVSAGFLPYFETRYPNVSKVVFTNGIDDEFLENAPIESPDGNIISDSSGSRGGRLIEVVYAGNMGEGQGLHNIVPALAKQLEDKIRFRLIGAGGRLHQLQNALEEAQCTNVVLEAPVARSQLIKIYQNADVLFLHLNGYDAFRKVLPSKIFEYGALGKPIWAGVAGYAARFINENLDNAAVFSPCDVIEAIKVFEKLCITDRPRTEFTSRFARKAIMAKMAKDLVAVGNNAL